MKTVGVYEARTRLSELIRDVAGGETIVITRHGSPIARLIPEPVQQERVGQSSSTVEIAPESADQERLARMIDEWFEYRKAEGLSLGGLSINELIDEGQR